MTSFRSVAISGAAAPVAKSTDTTSKLPLVSRKTSLSPSGDTVGAKASLVLPVSAWRSADCVSTSQSCSELYGVDRNDITTCRLSGIQAGMGVPA